MFSIRHTARNTAQFLTCSIATALVLFTFSPVAAAELPHTCKAPFILLEQDQIRHGEGAIGETHCYRLDLTSPGLLHLDVAAAASLPSGLTIDVFRAEASAQPLSLGRTPNERLSLVDAGAWHVEIKSEDPRRPLAAYRLTSRFIEITKSETDGEVEIEPEGFAGTVLNSETDGEVEIEPEGLVFGHKSETDGEVEIEPEGFAGTVLNSETDGEVEIEPEGLLFDHKSETDGEVEIEPEGFAGTVLNSETDGEVEIEPEGFLFDHKSETDGEVEIEPEGFASDDTLLALVDRLCRLNDADDHADTLACATPLTGTAEGELDNGWGDDADVFTFEIHRWQTIEILTSGKATARVSLFDDYGHRLATGHAEAGIARMVRTLGPGSYFIRVEEADADGLYALAVRDLGR